MQEKSHANTASSLGSSADPCRKPALAFFTRKYRSALSINEYFLSFCQCGAVTASGTTNTILAPSCIALFTTRLANTVGG
jgi:hypothetical protein